MRKWALVSFIAVLWARAARLTERWRDQATRPRQSRTLMAMKPRMAPTTMKTVPSGRLLCCMKGAWLVFGTMGVTILPTPVNVGRLVGSDGRAPAFVPAADDPDPVIVGGAVFVPFVPLPVIEIFAAVSAAPVAFAVFTEDFPFVCVADDRLGRFVGAAPCADAPIVSSETASAVERSGVFRKSLMVKGLYNCCAKRSRRP